MLVRNEIYTDPRVFKMANSIAKDVSADLRVVCYVNGGVDKKYEKDDNGYEIYRFGSGVKRVKESVIQKNGGVNLKIDRTVLAYFYIMWLNIKLFMFCRHFKSDFYHANDFDTLPAAYLLSLKHGGQVVYDAHELYSEMYSDYTKPLKRLITITEHFLIRRCRFFITVNKSIYNELDRRYHNRFGFVVMNCPVYSGTMRYYKEDLVVKFIYVGSYQEERGLDKLINRLKLVTYDNFKLYMMGWGPLETELRCLVDSLNLNDKVEFLEPVEMKDIVKTLTEFDVGIIPYIPVSINNLYSTPNKLFEYMMAGCAVISTNLPEIEKIVKKSNCGCIFDPNTYYIEDHITYYCIDGKFDKSRMLYTHQDNALIAAEEYNWENQVKCVIDEYNKLIANIN